MRTIRKKKALIALGFMAALTGGGAAVAGALAAGGNSFGAPPAVTTGPSPPDAYVSTVATLPTTPVSAASAVSSVLSLMVGSDIVSVKLGSPPSDLPTPSGQPAVPALYVTVRIPDVKNADDTEALWEADLLEGAVVDEAGSSHALSHDIGYVAFDGRLPDGTIVPDIGGGMGNIARGQQFAGATDSDATIRGSVNATLSAYGLTLDSLKIFHVLGAAPAVVVTTPGFAQTASQYPELLASLFGSPPRYQGWYLEIRGSDGTPYVQTSASFVTGVSSFWINPSVNGEGGLQVSPPSPSPASP